MSPPHEYTTDPRMTPWWMAILFLLSGIMIGLAVMRWLLDHGIVHV